MPVLEAALRNLDLSQEVALSLSAAYVRPWRQAKIANRTQVAGLWVNLALAALKVPRPGHAYFALACSGQLLDEGELAPLEESFRRFIRAQALLVLADSEESTSPEVCRNVLRECEELCGCLLQWLDEIPRSQAVDHCRSALAVSLSAVRILVYKRHALAALATELIDACEAAIYLADGMVKAELDLETIWQSIADQDRGSLDPLSHLHFIAGSAHWQLDEEPGLLVENEPAQHALQAAEHLARVELPEENLTDSLAASVRIVRASVLSKVGLHEEALSQLRLLPDSAEGPVDRERYGTEASLYLKLGNFPAARDRLLRIAPSAIEEVAAWRARWLASKEGLPAGTDLTARDPLEEAQSLWRELVLVSVRLGDLLGAAAWSSMAIGFLIDSIIQDRAGWAAELRGREGLASRFNIGWQSSSRATSQLSEDLAQSLRRSEIPLAAHRPTGKPRGADKVSEIRDALEQLGPDAAIFHPIVIEGRIFNFSGRLIGGRLEWRQLGDEPCFQPLLDRLQEWQTLYFEQLRPGILKDGAAQPRRLFQSVLQQGEQLWGRILEDVVAEGITQLVVVSDELLADFPFHAVRLPSRGATLIDVCLVSYCPSFYSLWCSLQQPRYSADARRGVVMRSLVAGGLASGLDEAHQLASILDTDVSIVDAGGTDFWENLAEAEILHIVTHGEHSVLLPLDAALELGEGHLPLWAVLASLELPRCAVASNVVCETAFPAIRRAPGIDFASGLLAAGARNVLASTWVVRDDLASRFTCLFFEQWAKGEGPGAAYRSAFREIAAEVDFEPSLISIRLVGPTTG